MKHVKSYKIKWKLSGAPRRSGRTFVHCLRNEFECDNLLITPIHCAVNYRCYLRFRFFTPNWLFPCFTLTLHKCVWCWRSSEFRGNYLRLFSEGFGWNTSDDRRRSSSFFVVTSAIFIVICIRIPILQFHFSTLLLPWFQESCTLNNQNSEFF